MCQLINRSLLLAPDSLNVPNAWVGHIPFAMWLVEVVQPRLLVELGTHSGNSYFSFCQSVLANSLETRCHAVDTWQGDQQAGHYDDEVYKAVAAHNEAHYRSFSNLLRMTFDEARDRFEDGSIDLLHIDGLHTYEAVRHDFETWLPKLSSRGIILFHDIAVKDQDFGVWRLWEELSARYPSISFEHTHGLGVLLVGEEYPTTLTSLLELWRSAEGRILIEQLFGRLGRAADLEYQAVTQVSLAVELEQKLANRDSQIAVLGEALADRESSMALLGEAIADRESSMALLGETIADRESSMMTLGQALADHESSMAILGEAIADRESSIAALNEVTTALQTGNEALQAGNAALQAENAALQAENAALYASTSWRITRPLRWCSQRIQQIMGRP